MPDINDPELFGLHPNAAISSANFECTFMVNCLLAIRSGSRSSVGSD